MHCPRCGQPVKPVMASCPACGLPAGSVMPPEGWGPPPPGWAPPAPILETQPAPPPDAGFWLRFLAYLVDALVLQAAALVLVAVMAAAVFGAARSGGGGAEAFSIAVIVVLALAWCAVPWLYFALQESSPRQSTLGKRALGLAVVDEGGARIGFGRATGRFFGKILSGLPLYAGFVMAGFTRRKQGLHDLLAHTRVVRVRPAGAGAVVAALVGVFLVGTALVGMLAAIAIPNFVRYQLRARQAQARSELAVVIHSEQLFHAAQGGYLALEGRQGAPLDAKRRAWSEAELAAARALEYEPGLGSYGAVRVEVAETEDGQQAWAACLETDLDEDGEVAAFIAFGPAEGPDGVPVAPEAPCSHDPRATRSLELQPGDPPGQPIPVFGADVF